LPDGVAKCLRAAPTCPAGTRPSYVLGDCCPSCIPPVPVCTTTCAAGEICIPQKDATTGVREPACRARDQLKFKLAARLRALFAGLSDADVRAFIKELIERFCDKNEASASCSRFRDEIDGLSIDVSTISDMSVDVVVNVPKQRGVAPGPGQRGMSAGFKLQAASESPSALVQAALTDGERNSEGLTVTYSNGVSTLAPVALLIAVLSAMALLLQ
jgi:hypothetical protein